MPTWPLHPGPAGLSSHLHDCRCLQPVLCARAHTTHVQHSSRGYSVTSQTMPLLCSKPSNHWSLTASHFQSLQSYLMGPLTLISSTAPSVAPLQPQWPPCYSSTPTAWPTSTLLCLDVHTWGIRWLNPALAPDLCSELTSSARPALVTPHPALPIIQTCCVSAACVITPNIARAWAYLLTVCTKI